MLNNRMWFSRTDFNSFLPFSMKRPIDRILCEPFSERINVYGSFLVLPHEMSSYIENCECLAVYRALEHVVKRMDLPSFQWR
jgi:hypothetical protein